MTNPSTCSAGADRPSTPVEAGAQTDSRPHPAPSLDEAVRKVQSRLNDGKVIVLEALSAGERRAARVLVTSGDVNASLLSSGLTALRRSAFR
jgi:hypothetical protein